MDNMPMVHPSRCRMCEAKNSRIEALERELAEALEAGDRRIKEARNAEKKAVNKLVELRRELAEARRDGERLEWAWSNPEQFLEAQRSTPPSLTGRQQIDAARGGGR